jgi:hypothetical protein
MCGGTQHLPGELLYTGAKIKVRGNAASDRKAIKAALEELVRPKPNSSFF